MKLARLSVRNRIMNNSSNMTYIVRVAEVNAFKDLPEASFHLCWVYPIGTSLQIIQHCVIDELKDEEQTLLSPKHFNQIDEIFVVKLLNKKKSKQYSECIIVTLQKRQQ